MLYPPHGRGVKLGREEKDNGEMDGRTNYSFPRGGRRRRRKEKKDAYSATTTTRCSGKRKENETGPLSFLPLRDFL